MFRALLSNPETNTQLIDQGTKQTRPEMGPWTNQRNKHARRKKTGATPRDTHIRECSEHRDGGQEPLRHAPDRKGGRRNDCYFPKRSLTTHNTHHNLLQTQRISRYAQVHNVSSLFHIPRTAALRLVAGSPCCWTHTVPCTHTQLRPNLPRQEVPPHVVPPVTHVVTAGGDRNPPHPCRRGRRGGRWVTVANVATVVGVAALPSGGKGKHCSAMEVGE